MKNILVVAFHFPPMGGSSGGLRSLKFVRYLPKHGWQPTVLTVHPRVYDSLDESGLDAVPKDTKIIRAFGLDTKKHLSIRSKYPGFLASPDRFTSWTIGAVPAGLRAIRRHNIDAIFSTYPIATTVRIGLLLERLSGLPWVADFRDPMIEDDYPRDPRTRRTYQQLENRAMERASKVIFTTDSTRDDLVKRYPDILAPKSVVIPNGYDEIDFAGIAQNDSCAATEKVRLVHGGIIYPEDRDPNPFFQAIQRLRERGVIDRNNTRVELRSSGFDDQFMSVTNKLGIADIVHFLPSLPYRESLADAANASGLLVLQGPSCDRQIPAKVYEYLRVGKPILALTSHEGETASVLKQTGGATIADITSTKEIETTLEGYLRALRQGSLQVPDRESVQRHSRFTQAAQLAASLDDVTES